MIQSDEEYVKCVRAVCQLRILNRGLWDDVVNVNLTPSVGCGSMT